MFIRGVCWSLIVGDQQTVASYFVQNISSPASRPQTLCMELDVEYVLHSLPAIDKEHGWFVGEWDDDCANDDHTRVF